jgi:hypothetical protein
MNGLGDRLLDGQRPSNMYGRGEEEDKEGDEKRRRLVGALSVANWVVKILDIFTILLSIQSMSSLLPTMIQRILLVRLVGVLSARILVCVGVSASLARILG